jgi:hypothetical protein
MALTLKDAIDAATQLKEAYGDDKEGFSAAMQELKAELSQGGGGKVSPSPFRGKSFTNWRVKAACQQGERSDLTGCTPASGEAGTPSTPKARFTEGQKVTIQSSVVKVPGEWTVKKVREDGMVVIAKGGQEKVMKAESLVSKDKDPTAKPEAKPTETPPQKPAQQAEPQPQKFPTSVDQLSDASAGMKQTPFEFKAIPKEWEEAPVDSDSVAEQKPVTIPIDELVSTQKFVDPGNVKFWMEQESGPVEGVVASAEYPLVIRQGGNYLLFSTDTTARRLKP